MSTRVLLLLGSATAQGQRRAAVRVAFAPLYTASKLAKAIIA